MQRKSLKPGPRALPFPESGRTAYFFPGFCLLCSGKLHRAHQAFAFFYEGQLIGLDVLQRINLPAGPANFQQIDLFCFSQSKVNT